MLVGFSLSPGGLLLPYHLGALASLAYHGRLTEQTPLAGSSAGAIAVAAHASGVSPQVALDAAIRISSQCDPFFVAKGRILPSLRQELDELLHPDAHQRVNEREGVVGLAHRELFPRNRSILQTHFETRDALMDAVCDSSMFPFFTSNRPFRYYHAPVVSNNGSAASKEKTPRITVDGVFAVPLHRFGCPDFRQASSRGPNIDVATNKKNLQRVERTVRIMVFPHELVDVIPSNEDNLICPSLEQFNIVGQVARLGLLATTSVPAKELTLLYEDGWQDAERWVRREERRRAKSSWQSLRSYFVSNVGG
jgi:hypothetical protein